MKGLCACRRFAISLAGALALVAVGAALARADRPAENKTDDPQVLPRNSDELSNVLGQVVWELRPILVTAIELATRPAQPTDPCQSMLVRVVGPAGKPLFGARVAPVEDVGGDPLYVFDENETTDHLGWNATITGLDGAVRIARPTTKGRGLQVRIEADGYVPCSARWSAPVPNEFTFKLEPSRAVGGIVRDPSGRPIAAARVALSLPRDAGAIFVQPDLEEHEEQTDARGRWECRHLPPRTEGLTITVSHDEYVGLDVNEATCAAQSADLVALKGVFVMKPGLVVQGTITDEKGKPVPAAQAKLNPTSLALGQAFPTRAEVTTGDDGRYRFANCLPGENTIYVAARGLVTQRRKVTIEPGMAPVDFRLAPGAPVKLRVVDPEGKPVSRAQIWPHVSFLFGYEPYVADTLCTDADGRWSLANSPEGEIALEVSRSGYATAHARVVAREQEHVVTLRPPLRIRGRVVDAVTKQPLTKVYVSADYRIAGEQAEELVFPAVDIDDQGRYEVVFRDTLGIDRVAWQIRVQAAGYVTQLSPKFETRAGSQTLDFQLARGKAVSGVIRRADGTPVAGAMVFAATAHDSWTVDNGRLGETGADRVCERSGADGRFALPRPLEPYVVGVVHDFGGAEITAQELDQRGEIVLQPWARVEGRIEGSVAGENEDKESIFLEADCDENRDTDKEEKQPSIDWSYMTDPDPAGRFAFARVLPGRRKAEAYLARFNLIDHVSCTDWRPQIFEAAPGQTVRVEFVRTGRRVNGRVELPTGMSRKISVLGGQGCLLFQRPLVPVAEHLAGASRDARQEWEKQWLNSEAGKAADRAGQNHVFSIESDGRFAAEGVAPGVYQLVAELFGRGENAGEVEQQLGWVADEIAIRPADAPCEEALAIGPFTAQGTQLFYGDPAPDFEFKTADGQSHCLSEYRGKNVVVEFTDKWSPPDWCSRGEATNELVNERGGGPLVWINLSNDPKPRPAVKVAKDAAPGFQYLQGSLPALADVFRAYDVHRPGKQHPVFIAADGKVVGKY